MKNSTGKIFLVFCCTFIVLCSNCFGQISEVWVSPTGSDSNTGTKEQPLASPSMAVRKVRELRRLQQIDPSKSVHIYLSSGRYFLEESIHIRPEDSGILNNPTILEAAPHAQVSISGGKAIVNWKLLKENLPFLPQKAKGKIWVANLPEGISLGIRQLWVNGKKATRAKNTAGIEMQRILSWNKKEQTCWIPAPKEAHLEQAKGLEFFIHQWWEVAQLRVKRIEVQGDSAKLTFFQPESRIQSEHPWPAPWISKETGNSAFYLCNALQFLDEAGEYYCDPVAQKIYYFPFSNENMLQTEAIASHLETLVSIEGTVEKPVQHFHIQNINFEHTAYWRPATHGHVAHQTGMPMTDAYKLKIAGTPEKQTLENQAWIIRPTAAVSINHSQNIHIQNCQFTHTASTGLDLYKGVHQSSVTGNVFKDIGGNGILVGNFSDEATEIHLPYNPTDLRDVSHHIQISNNLISDATNEDWGSVGIGVGFAHDIQITHNDISNVHYSGISVGWGWTRHITVLKNNLVKANKIRLYGKNMYDVAGIYTLSAQPNTQIIENVIDSIYRAPYAHIPSHWFYLYTDEGSSFMTIRDNWTASTKYLQNANGPANTWENNGPSVADSTYQKAGLAPQYQSLFRFANPYDARYAINIEKPVIVELVTAQGKTLDKEKLKVILGKSKISTSSVYQWQNHTVIFDKVQDVYLLQDRLKNAFPDVKIKTYHDLFYEFNREKCGEKKKEGAWKHILLTANLVADPNKQKAYLDAHATQFEKWPEVSKGFCNADFQQLLLFRNGRQLMLVISIPAEADFEKLNPRTTLNNPRVNDWNKAMKDYQEGLEDAPKGDTWEFFKSFEF